MECPPLSAAPRRENAAPADTAAAEETARAGAALRRRHFRAARRRPAYWLRQARLRWEASPLRNALARFAARQRRSFCKHAERLRALLRAGPPIALPPERDFPEPPPLLFDHRYYKDQWPGKRRPRRSWWGDYLAHGWKHGFNPHPLFDVRYYLAQNPDVRAARVDPLTHYLRRGWEEGRDPNPYFRTDWYIARNPELLLEGKSPLEHYLARGWKNGRDPGPRFSLERHRARLPNSSPAVEPLGEWLQQTASEHRGGRFREYVHWPVTYLADTPPRPPEGPAGRIAVQIHAFYLDKLDLLLGYLRHLPGRFDLLVSTNAPEQAREIETLVAQSGLDCGLEIRLGENRGRDVAPLVCLFGRKLLEYDYALHVHTKKSAAVKAELDYGAQWLVHNLECLARTPGYLQRIFALFRENPHCGILAPLPWRRIRRGVAWTANRPHADALIARLGLPPAVLDSQPLMFPTGTMFWFRPRALRPLFESDLSFGDFPPEPLPNDGSIAHAVERCICYIALSQGYHSLVVAPSFYQPESQTTDL